MTARDPLPLLKEWPGNWHHPELWRIACDVAPAEREVIIQSLLEWLSRPAEPFEIFRTLVTQGSFKAAEAFLLRPPFSEAISDVQVEGDDAPDFDLDQRRLMARGEILGAIDVLLMRNARAGSPIARDDPRLSDALEWSLHDVRRAHRLLEDLETTIAHAEDVRIEELRAKVDERTGARVDAMPRALHDAIERSLRQRQLDIAEALLAGTYDTSHSEATLVLPDPLPNGRFGDCPPLQLCRWVLSKEKMPPDFVSWDVVSIDGSSRSLFETIEHLCERGPSEEDVTRFVAELERLLKVEEPLPTIERDGNVFRTSLRGLEEEACPVFAETAVPFLIPVDGEICDAAARSISPVVIFDVRGQVGGAGNYAVLTVWDIVRCLSRPADFRFNLLRLLARQLNRHRVIPRHDHAPENWMLSVRSSDARAIAERAARAPQLVSGAAGIGKTSVLRSFLMAFGDDGWTTRFVGDASQLATSDDSVLGDETGSCAFAIDNGHELDATALARLIIKASGTVTGKRLVVGGSPALPRKFSALLPDDSHYRLGLVRFSTIRSFAERVFDLHGHPVPDVVLDRVALYAAGRPALLYALIHAVFLEVAQRPVLSGVPVSTEHVETAYRRKEFVNAARSILVTSLEADAHANLVLAAILVIMELEIERNHLAGVQIDRVVQWLELEGISMPRGDWDNAVGYLRDLELVTIDDRNSRVSLSTLGGGYALISLLPADRLQYFSDVKARLTPK